MYKIVVWRNAAVAAALLFAAPSMAAGSLTLQEALRRAEATHPDLQGFSAEREAAAAGRVSAGRSPSPEVSILLEDALGNGSRRGLDASQWTLSFSQALELGGQRAARLSLADARLTALSAHQEVRRRDALAGVAQRFYEAAVDRERLRLAEEQVELARKTLRAAEDRVSSARAPVAERARAQAAVAQATLEREHAEHEELTARVSLAVSMGSSEPDFGDLEASMFTLPALRPSWRNSALACAQALPCRPGWQKPRPVARSGKRPWLAAGCGQR